MPKNAKVKLTYSFVKILHASDLTRRRLPQMTAVSPHDGPLVWLTACMHGDEVGGMVVVQEIFKLLSTRLLRGRVYAFPMLNPIGFEYGSRQIPLSDEDLNRSFPGDPHGSLAERIGDRIFSTITSSQPQLVIDIHNDWHHSIPYTVIDPLAKTIQPEVMKHTKQFAQASGLVTVVDSDDLESSLSYSLLLAGVPALTLELGEAKIVNEKNVTIGVQAVWSMLQSAGLVDALADNQINAHPINDILVYSDQPTANTSGLLRFLVKPGEEVEAGQSLAKVSNAFGKIQETLVAPERGIILGHTDYSVAFPGTPVFAIGHFPTQTKA